MNEEKHTTAPSVSIENLCGCAWAIQTPVLLDDATEATVDVRCPVHERFGLRLRIRLPGAINTDLLEACKAASTARPCLPRVSDEMDPCGVCWVCLCHNAVAKAEGK